MAYEHKEGQGSLMPNKYKQEGDRKPSYKGKIKVGGKLWDIAAWKQSFTSGDEYFGLKVSEPYVKPEEQPTQQGEDSSLPF